MAEDFGTLPPLIQAVPLVYNIAALESAANIDAGSIRISSQLRTPRKVKARIASPTAGAGI
jgi:hypothetical protein